MKNIPQLLLVAIVALSLILVACSDGTETKGGGGGITDTNLILPAGPTPKVVEADGRLILSWSAVSGVTAYQVFYNESDYPVAAKSAGYTTDTNYVLPLANGTKYYVWVKAWKEYSDGYKVGPFGGVGTGTPKVADTAPGKVAGLKADPKQVSIKLSWTEVPAASSYKVQRKEGGYFNDLTGYTNLRSAFATISNLEPSTEYTFRVIAVNTKDPGPESDAITTTTLAPYSLTKDTWDNRSISIADDLLVYEVLVPARTTYYVQWNDDRYGDKTKTGRIKVSARWQNTNGLIPGWTAINSYTATYETSDTAPDNPWNKPLGIENADSGERTVRIIVDKWCYPIAEQYRIKGGTYGILYFDKSDLALHTPPTLDEVNFVPPNKVHLKWNKITEADSYNVYRATSLDGNYSKVTTIVPTTDSADPEGEKVLASEYTDTALTAGTTYYYAVSATIGSKESPRSVPAKVIAIPTATPLKADTEYINTSDINHMYTFAVTTGKTYIFDIRKTSTGTSTLYWDVYSSNGEKIDSFDDSEEYTATASETLYIVLAPSASLTYRVKIYDKDGAKPQDIPTSVTVAGAKVGDTYTATVNWNYKGTDEETITGFEIYRSTTSEFSGYTKVKSAEATDTTWTDTVTLGSTYYYRVAAKNANGEGSQSAYTSVIIALPGVPTITRVASSFDTPTATTSRIIVTWGSVVGATSYRVYREATDTFNDLGTVTGTTYSENVDSTFGSAYTYQVVAINDYGSSARSAAVSGGNAPQELTSGEWFNGTLVAGSTDWYKFSVTEGTRYNIWWNDSYQGPNPRTKTVDIVVGAWYGNGTPIFGNGNNIIDSGWDTAQFFTANADGTVYVRVRAYNASATSAGTYGVVFTEGNDPAALTRP